MATTKKTSEATFTTKTVGELTVGDRFREIQDPGRELVDIPLQEVISVEKEESSLFDDDQVTKKEIVICSTSVEGSVEKFRFTAFSKIKVQVLDV